MEPSIAFTNVAPVVPSRNLEATLAFYRDKLGFAEFYRAGDPLDAAGMKRDGVNLHFFRCDDPKIGEWTGYRVRTGGMDALYRHCTDVSIVHPNGPLRNTPWGTREFVALDPDGVAITFWEPADE